VAKIALAEIWAQAYHHGKKRRFSGESYAKHPIRVAALVSLVPDATDDMICAALLHDLVEDTEVTLPEIRRVFGDSVGALVAGLTRPSAAMEGSRRAHWKQVQADREHMKTICPEAKIIKLCDRLDNLKDIELAAVEFSEWYLRDSEEMLEDIGGASEALSKMLSERIEAKREQIKAEAQERPDKERDRGLEGAAA